MYAGDYAWLTEAFTRLGEATGLSSWTQLASETASSLLDLFWDKETAGFFTSGNHFTEDTDRPYEGPAGRGHAVRQRHCRSGPRPLGRAHGGNVPRCATAQTVALMASPLSRVPAAFPGLALVGGYLGSARRQVVVASSAPALVRPVWERFLPDTVLAWGEPYPSPVWEGRTGPEASGQAFVCEAYTCQLPVTGPAELGALLDQIGSGLRGPQPEAARPGAR